MEIKLRGTDLVGKRVRYFHAGEQEIREGKVIKNYGSDLFDVEDDLTRDYIMEVYILDIKEVFE